MVANLNGSRRGPGELMLCLLVATAAALGVPAAQGATCSADTPVGSDSYSGSSCYCTVKPTFWGYWAEVDCDGTP